MLFLLLLCTILPTAAVPSKPNFVWFLTDDQDQMLGASFPTLGGATPMGKTKALMAEEGATALNFFIHTPICCPSRSELLTGRYFHNIKQVGADGACMHCNETRVNQNTFAKYLSQEGGYTVGMFGKYLNNVPVNVPPGFDAWLANGGGNYIAPEFATKNIDGIPDGKWHGTPANYSTSVIGNVSMAWIKKAAHGDKPFFAYIAPKAAHEPFNPAPWYVDHWDASWPEHEPRPETWNSSMAMRKDHHGNIATQPMITAEAAKVITGVFKNRWRTLMSVDDVIADVIALCQDLKIMDKTYFFFSSDHGFQLGEFNILMDKRQVYETNTRIHLLARGPGIAAGSSFANPATQVDLAPTFLGMAGVAKPAQMDGRSIAPLIITTAEDAPQSTQDHLGALGDRERYVAGWRDMVFLEYYYNADNDKCVEHCNGGHYPKQDSMCTNLVHEPNEICWGRPGCDQACYPTETLANNFIAIRSMPGSPLGDVLYAEYQTGNLNKNAIDFDAPDFHEYYNVSNDKWQAHNLYSTADPAVLKTLHEKLHEWYNCAGDACP